MSVMQVHLNVNDSLSRCCSINKRYGFENVICSENYTVVGLNSMAIHVTAFPRIHYCSDRNGSLTGTGIPEAPRVLRLISRRSRKGQNSAKDIR